MKNPIPPKSTGHGTNAQSPRMRKRSSARKIPTAHIAVFAKTLFRFDSILDNPNIAVRKTGTRSPRKVASVEAVPMRLVGAKAFHADGRKCTPSNASMLQSTTSIPDTVNPPNMRRNRFHVKCERRRKYASASPSTARNPRDGSPKNPKKLCHLSTENAMSSP